MQRFYHHNDGIMTSAWILRTTHKTLQCNRLDKTLHYNRFDYSVLRLDICTANRAGLVNTSAICQLATLLLESSSAVPRLMVWHCNVYDLHSAQMNCTRVSSRDIEDLFHLHQKALAFETTQQPKLRPCDCLNLTFDGNSWIHFHSVSSGLVCQ